MSNAKTPKPQAVSAEPLPMMALLRFDPERMFEEHTGQERIGMAETQLGDYVRLSDAQAIIDHLTREHDHALMAAACEADAGDSARAELVALKAAQIAPLVDVEKIMGLADAMVKAKCSENHANLYGSLARWAQFGRDYEAAREALRAALAASTDGLAREEAS